VRAACPIQVLILGLPSDFFCHVSSCARILDSANLIFCCSREEHGGPFCFSVSRVVGRQKGFSFPARNSSAEWLYLLEHAARLFAQ
jgi:hypothetical protein